MNGALFSQGCERRAITERWQVASARAGSDLADVCALTWIDARVPGTAVDAMRAAGHWDWDTPLDIDAQDWWWRARFDTDSVESVIGFDGLATLADVWLDGELILHGENMFVARQATVRSSGSHELLIRCAALAPALEMKRPRPRWRVPMLKSAQLRWFRTTLLGRTPGWSPPCPAVGPWRPVWIAAAGSIAPRMQSRLVDGIGHIDVALALADDVTAATLVVERGTQRIESPIKRVDGLSHATLRIDKPALWWPHTHGEPVLYDVHVVVETGTGGKTIALGRTGFRDIEIVREDGEFAVRVNGADVFCRGACWTPLDVVGLQASADDYASAIEQVRAAGMNMLRLSGAMVYEQDAFYDALDAAGILLWQDFMFANMDYPEDASFEESVLEEVDQQIARFTARPCLALFCGNSEVEQQAAMSGAARALWSPRLFHATIAARVAAAGFAYIPSSAHGGAFPHGANAGASSYYGVGAYLRPLDDARRSGLRFGSECLAFANIPADEGLPGGVALRVHHAAWKARSPRDLGAGWDFDDVRDHYVRRLYALDPTALRVSDHERYMALGRAATGEVMGAAFSEWRRASSPTRGALIWFLRDLWPGAGWGIIDAHGTPKLCYYAVRRALAPVAVAISDEGINGLIVHAFNDGPQTIAATIEFTAYRRGEIEVCKGRRTIELPARGSVEIPATDLLEGFYDLSFAYRFGPAMADVVHAVLRADDRMIGDAFHFPEGLPNRRETDIGLAVDVVSPGGASAPLIEVSTRRFAQNVTIETPGFVPDDNGFHLAPGQRRRIALRARDARPSFARDIASALNADSVAHFELR